MYTLVCVYVDSVINDTTSHDPQLCIHVAASITIDSIRNASEVVFAQSFLVSTESTVVSASEV